MHARAAEKHIGGIKRRWKAFCFRKSLKCDFFKASQTLLSGSKDVMPISRSAHVCGVADNALLMSSVSNTDNVSSLYFLKPPQQ